MIKIIKKVLRRIVGSTPILSDYYFYYWLFPRVPNSFRGVYSSFTEALDAVPSNSTSGYNHEVIYNSSGKRKFNIDEVGKFNSVDYPVLAWLGEIFKHSATVFDLGGNIGNSYYAYRKFISYPPNLRWLICDLPEAVKVGQEILAQFESPGLVYTTSFADAEGSDIFFTCGTLQYLEVSLAELLSQLQTKPRHLLINQVPFYNGDQYVTLQNLLFVDSVNKKFLLIHLIKFKIMLGLSMQFRHLVMS